MSDSEEEVQQEAAMPKYRVRFTDMNKIQVEKAVRRKKNPKILITSNSD